MPRKPAAKSGPTIERPRSWQDVDHLVHLMARTDGDMATAKAEADERVRQINADLDERLAPLLALHQARQECLETFAVGHRKDLAGEQSMALAHGRVGWRMTPPAVKFLRPQEEVVAVLEDRGLYVAVLVTKRPSKEVLVTLQKDLGAEGLKEIGVRVTQDEKFYVEYAEASVSDAPAAAAKT